MVRGNQHVYTAYDWPELLQLKQLAPSCTLHVAGEHETVAEDIEREHQAQVVLVLECGVSGLSEFLCARPRRLVHGGGRRLRRTTDAVGKSVVPCYAAVLMKRSP